MLYNQPDSRFRHLTETLTAAGVPEETVAILPEFLDTEKPRNLSLIENIQKQRYASNYSTSTAFIKAVKKDLPIGQDELWLRWCLYIYAVAGNSCTAVGFEPYVSANAYLIRALCQRYGETEGQARYYAFEISQVCYNINTRYYRLSDVKVKSPEECLRALPYADTYQEKLVLTLYALDQCKPPATGLKAIFSTDHTLIEALASLKDLYQTGTERQKYPALAGTAVAAAARLSDTWRQVLRDNYQQARTEIAGFALWVPIQSDNVLDMLDTLDGQEREYLFFLAKRPSTSEEQQYFPERKIIPNRDVHLHRLARKSPEIFKEVLQSQTIVIISKLLTRIYQEEFPDEHLPDLRERTRQRVIEACCTGNEAHSSEISMYLLGSDTLENLLPLVPQLKKIENYWRVGMIDYTLSFGVDSFAERCICFLAIVNYDMSTVMRRILCVEPGYQTDDQRQVLGVLFKHNVPMQYILNFCGNINWERTINNERPVIEILSRHGKEIAAVDPSVLCSDARRMTALLLHETGEFDRLFDYAADPGKNVRSAVCEYLPAPGGDYDAKYIQLLESKKQAVREVAVTMLEKHFSETLREAVQTAYSKEKNAGLQARLAVLLGEAAPEQAAEVAEADIIASLTKGSKPKKVEFLFTAPFAPVHRTDGSEADEKILKALAVCYADQTPCGRSTTADRIAEGLNPGELEAFACEAFARWLNQGAPAKTKWVLYLTAVHGGMEAITGLSHYIKDWSENSRGALAAEAVKALAMNGTSTALMLVDGMARKFKNKQVRGAAGTALQEAADALGLTREELADKIVPDLGFDENRCRVFDFGTRQIKVYITPELELEIFDGDKKMKSFPKPGSKDDPEKSEAASKDFKEMKKAMKTAIQNQKDRLEYVLLCDRKWTAEGWKALFIQKPIMHCFAIGLIWGVYEEGKLVQSFRFMEDGSFNTPDEEEYELPENAVIGLVHPLELDEDLRNQWIEQLSDYEIKQPFPQLTRNIYRITDKEATETEMLRVEGRTLIAVTLLGRMTRLGWDKGEVLDGGMFASFVRTDISSQTRNEDGEIVREGFWTELYFSGMDIAGYTNDEEVTIEKVEFYTLHGRDPLPLSKIPPRYFSEIVNQLNGAL